MSGPTRAHSLAGLAGVPAALALAPSRPARAAGKLALDYGVPLRTVFLYSRPEWTAIVVGHDSPLKSLRDLKGKRVSTTRAADPLRDIAYKGRAMPADRTAENETALPDFEECGRLRQSRPDAPLDVAASAANRQSTGNYDKIGRSPSPKPHPGW